MSPHPSTEVKAYVAAPSFPRPELWGTNLTQVFLLGRQALYQPSHHPSPHPLIYPLQSHSHLSRNHLTRPPLCARLPHCRPMFQAEDKRHLSPYIRTRGGKSEPFCCSPRIQVQGSTMNPDLSFILLIHIHCPAFFHCLPHCTE